LIQEQLSNIESIISEISCVKDVRCFTSGFKNICKAKEIGSDSYLECLDENPKLCNFSSSVDGTHHCRCPLRIYILKNMQI